MRRFGLVAMALLLAASLWSAPASAQDKFTMPVYTGIT